MFKQVFYILLIGVLIQSCSYFKTKHNNDKKIIARVNDVFLYQDDIMSILPKGYSKTDSVLFITNYINSWAKQELLYSRAKINLNDNQKEIQELVNKYKQDLLINKYKRAVVSQNLDTLIIETEIDEFYKSNNEIFILNEKLIKFKYLQIRKNVSELKKIKKLFKSNKEEDLIELEELELVFRSFNFNDSVWIKYSEALKLVPILKKNQSRVVANSYIEKQVGTNLYLVKINKTLERNQLAPKSYVKQSIKQMILHNRKLILLKDIEKTLLNDATKNGEYEIYK